MQPSVASLPPVAMGSAHRLPHGAPSPHSSATLRRAGFSGPIDAELTRIIDGDTFEARVRIWFGQEITTLVRIRGIDAPELRSRCVSEANGAARASEALADYLSPGGIKLLDVSLDKYGGRVLATVKVTDPAQPGESVVDVAELMLSGGLARPYGGGKRDSWCNMAEKED